MLQITHERWASSEYIDMIIIETSAADRERLAADMRVQAHSIRMQQGPGKKLRIAAQQQHVAVHY